MSASPELAAHPLSQVARVLTWGALGLLAYGAASWVVAQPWFALRSIEVKTPVAHVTEAQIRLVAERQVRGTFFTVDLEGVRNSLEKLPWVREARVERRWPDTLVVSLTEHVPLARWNDNALINQAGEVFVAAVSTHLPRLSGPEDSSAEVVAAYRRHRAVLAPLGMTIDELRLSPRRAGAFHRCVSAPVRRAAGDARPGCGRSERPDYTRHGRSALPGRLRRADAGRRIPFQTE